MKPMEGYNRQGKLYSARLGEPSNSYNTSATIQAGDIKFTISVTQPNMILSGVCVCHVNQDGSFYLFTEEYDRSSRGYFPPEYRSILYYSAGGVPLARVPEVVTGDDQQVSGVWAKSSWHERIALGADGSLYLLQAKPEERGDTTHFDVSRLKFGEAR